MASLKEKYQAFKNNPHFTMKEQLGFASGSFGNAMGQDCVGTYTDQFFRDHMGLETRHTLTLKSTTKIVNIVSAPIIGALLDSGKPGQNRSNKFMLASALPLTIASVLIFTVPSGTQSFRFLWSFLLFLLFHIADTFYDISLMTISARMTQDVDARKTFYTFASFAATLGSMLPGWILPVVVDKAKMEERSAYFMVALIFGILGFLSMIVPSFTLKEKVMLQREVEQKTKIDLRLILLNKPLMLLELGKVIDSVRQVCYNALPFFYKQTLDDFKMKSIVEACSGTLSYIGLASVPFVGKKLSSRDMVSFGYLWTGICYIILMLVGYRSKIIVGILIAIAGFPNAAMGAARRILLADSTDYMEWKSFKKFGTAVRNEGMVFSFDNMIANVSSLWKDLMIDLGLRIIGYKSAVTVGDKTVEVEQTPQTLRGIFWLVVIPGIVGNFLPGLIMRFDDYTGKKKENILRELHEIREMSGAPAPVEEA
ncbi:MAG: MFS transporter [Clostridia bacterium]|nr:MFS transporter [Clostridia bacterium]